MPSIARRVLAVVALLALLGSACTAEDGPSGAPHTGEDPGAGSEAAAAVEPELYEGDDFYAVPDPLPEGEHGTLIRYQAVDDFDVGGAQAWRVMYLSESLEGEPIAVTGTVLVPPGEPPAELRRVVTVAHGTTGIADECAPSKSPGGEMALFGPYIEAGYVIAVTDYEGLGTPGRHPYLVGQSEGRSVLDAVLAAQQLPGSGAGSEVAIAGYSQGGHGALFANQLAPEWTPDLQPVGVVAGAPATELDVIFAAAGALPGARGFLMLIVAGYAEAYPDADPASILTDEGERRLDEVDQGCVGDVLGGFADTGGTSLFEPDPGSIEPWDRLAEENNPGQVVTEAPVLIVHSAADTTVPAVLSEMLFQRMCGNGQVVERRVYEKGQGHVAAAPDAYADALVWFEDRFAGTPAVSTCPAG